MTSATEAVQLWDNAYADWRGGDDLPHDERLARWYGAYTATDAEHRADPRFFPEPYLGHLDGVLRAVTIGLNPGKPNPAMQARDGVFPQEVAALGSYSAWAATWPYVGTSSWTRRFGRNKFHESRFAFLRAVFGPLRTDEVTCFELYPWHSNSFKAASFHANRAPLREYVWGLLGDLGSPPVFTFGETLLKLITRDADEVLAVLGRGGGGENLGRPSRTVVVARLPGDSVAVAESTRNFFNPPSHDGRTLMIKEVERVLDGVGIVPPWRC